MVIHGDFFMARMVKNLDEILENTQKIVSFSWLAGKSTIYRSFSRISRLNRPVVHDTVLGDQ